VLKNKALLLSVVYTFALTILSLIKIDFDDVEENIPSFSDKVFHFLAYFIFTWLWFNAFFYHFNFNKIKSILLSVLVSVTFGIVIEVLQHLITTSRGFDILDIFANILGVIISAILINNYIKIDVKKY
jgi:VanZ family protein